MNSNRTDESIFPERILVYANLWERTGAFIIDALITVVIAVTVNSTLWLPFSWVAVAWLYESLSLSGYYQATIGQRTMGIKVCHENGGRLDFSQASSRFLGKFLSAGIFFAGFLMILKSPLHQTLHDEIAESLVVTEESYQAAI